MYSRTLVTRTLKGNVKQFKVARARVIGVDWKKKIICHVAVNTVLIKGKEIQFELAGNSSYPSSS